MDQVAVPDEFKYLYQQNERRPVVKVPAEVLRQHAEEVTRIDKEVFELIDRMKHAMKLANGIGLAAPQMGVSKRVILVAPMDTKPVLMINPKITRLEGTQVGEEGCLSIPGLYGDVERALSVTVEAYDVNGRCYQYDMEGMAARVVQHEVDHLEGILFIDKVNQETLHWMHPEEGVTE